MSSDAFYKELLPEITAALNDYGKAYQVRSKGLMNEETRLVAPGVTRSVQGLVSDGSIVSNIGSVGQNSGLEANRVQWVGKKVILLAPNLKPNKTDEINVDGVWLSLSKIVELKPANIVLLYILDLTK